MGERAVPFHEPGSSWRQQRFLGAMRQEVQGRCSSIFRLQMRQSGLVFLVKPFGQRQAFFHLDAACLHDRCCLPKRNLHEFTHNPIVHVPFVVSRASVGDSTPRNVLPRTSMSASSRHWINSCNLQVSWPIRRGLESTLASIAAVDYKTGAPVGVGLRMKARRKKRAARDESSFRTPNTFAQREASSHRRLPHEPAANETSEKLYARGHLCHWRAMVIFGKP